MLANLVIVTLLADYKDYEIDTTHHATLHQKSNKNVKTGQMSQLFAKYNKYISEQRGLVERSKPRTFSNVTSRQEAPYHLDQAYVDKLERKARQ